MGDEAEIKISFGFRANCRRFVIKNEIEKHCVQRAWWFSVIGVAGFSGQGTALVGTMNPFGKIKIY